MSNIKNSRGASQPDGIELTSQLLSTDVYLYQVQERFRERQKDLVGKILTFIDAISENEQVAKARKDIASDILYKGIADIIKQSEYEMEWLNRFLYDAETLKQGHFSRNYQYDTMSEAYERYEKSVRPS